MKGNVTKITYVLVFISIAFVVINLSMFQLYSENDYFIALYFFLNAVFITSIILFARELIKKNDRQNLETIQHQKTINKEIFLAKERYDIVAKATSDTVWDWKFKDNFFTWNNGICTMFGYDEQDVQNTSNWWFERIHPEDSIRVSVKLYSFIEQKTEKWQDEYRFRCKDGSYKYVLDRGFLVLNRKGQPTRMIGAMQDITNKKIEEERLKLLETVVINTVDSVVIMSHESSGKMPRIIYANEAFCKMTQYEITEVVNSSPELFFDVEMYPKFAQIVIDKISEKKEFEIEAIGLTKTNQRIWVQLSMVPVVNAEKEVTHWISIQRDVTNQKKQEKEMQQLIVELTQNNKDLRQFSYITSHNLRAPLSNLIGLLKYLDHKNIEDIELQNIIDGFAKSTTQLYETVEDLNKIVIIRDNPSISKEHLSLIQILEKVKDELNHYIAQHDVEIHENISPECKVFANKVYLESIIMNLLSNSLKFKKKEGLAKVQISLNEFQDHTELIVEDNGIGIDLPRVKNKIFGLYQKFHDDPSSKGMGLYLVKSQIESMGGTIEVESVLNQGAKFIIKFKKDQDVT